MDWVSSSLQCCKLEDFYNTAMKGEEKQIDEDVSLHKTHFSYITPVLMYSVFAELSVDKASYAYAMSNYSS